MSAVAAGIALAPTAGPEDLDGAVRAGGGEVVDPAEADGLVWTDIRDPRGLARLLDEYGQIRWVQLTQGGVDRFADHGLLDDERLWTSAKGAYGEPVAEHGLALALAGLRNLKRYARADSWNGEGGISLMRGRVTVFGGGGVAQAMLRLLAPFGCEVTVIRKRPEPMEGARDVIGFDRRYEALKGADVVFLTHALTPETAGTIGTVELEVMEPHCWLVNIARGRLVVTDDLAAALAEDAIGGAALDVTDPEPLPAGHPLWELPNCLITPHVANTDDVRAPLLVERVAENVRRFTAGQELLGRVDPALGY